MAVSQAEYKKLLERERGRAAGPQTGRDDAVRRANIAAGFGSSTAERFLGGPYKLSPKGGGGRKGGGKGGGGGGGGARVPAPEPRPDASSPARDPSLMWPGATAGPGVSPDLAVSPPHERWPGATAGGGGGGPQVDWLGNDIPIPQPRPGDYPEAATGVTQPSPITPMAATGVTQASPDPLASLFYGRAGERPGAFPAAPRSLFRPRPGEGGTGFPAQPGLGTPGYGIGGDKLLSVPGAWPGLFDFLRPAGLHG